jgi:hypothetical protein
LTKQPPVDQRLREVSRSFSFYQHCAINAVIAQRQVLDFYYDPA